MKKYIILSYVTLLAIFSSFKSDDFDCESFFPTIEGVSIEYTNYNEKNKITGYSKQTVKEVKESGNGVEVTMQIETTDEKKEKPYTGEMTFKCEGDKYFIDMSNMLPAETMEAYKDMEVEMDADFLEFPSNPVAGQTLPDGSLIMQIKSNGMTFMTMTIDVTDRKVDGFETITTAAGTFDCVKFSQTVNSKTLFNITSRSITWMTKDIGMIRTEDYNDKGKLRSVSELTGYKK